MNRRYPEPPNKILGASLRSSTESIILSLTGRCLVSREQCWVMCRHASQWDGLANTRSAAHLLDPSSDIQRYWRSIHATDVLTGREHGPSTPLVCTDHLGSHLGRRSRQTVVRWNQCFFWEPLGHKSFLPLWFRDVTRISIPKIYIFSKLVAWDATRRCSLYS